jgi:hypothetical protein
MSIRSQMAWYWRWLGNVLMMLAVGGGVWWLVENSYQITGLNREETRQQLSTFATENRVLRRDLDATRSQLIERDRQLQIDRASQSELARNVAQLQDENATLKEDLAFLRKMMSSGATPEGLGVSNLKVVQDGRPNEFRYHMLLTQGGQRKNDFKGRLEVVAHAQRGGTMNTFTFPDAAIDETAGAVEFRFYQKVEGRFRLPDDALLKSVEVRVLAMPGGQVKLARTLNFS